MVIQFFVMQAAEDVNLHLYSDSMFAERGLTEYCVIFLYYALQSIWSSWSMAHYSDLLKAVYFYQNSNAND